MTDSPAPIPSLQGTVLDFTPVPMARQRGGGWSVAMQRRFIAALAAMGSVGAACKACGMGRVSAYRLREREGAESFAAAWDKAIEDGRLRQYDYAMERALNGVTTVRVLRGGSVSVTCGPDMQLVNTALRDVPTPPEFAR
jgi:hypothetical protein